MYKHSTRNDDRRYIILTKFNLLEVLPQNLLDFSNGT